VLDVAVIEPIVGDTPVAPFAGATSDAVRSTMICGQATPGVGVG
jgi:hypothetical protein